MKKIAFILSLIASICINSNLLNAQWVSTQGPGGGHILALASDGNNYYASVEGHSIFISSDDGQTWSEKNNGLSGLNILSIAASGTSVYAGTNNGGIFFSTDNGNSWKTKNTGLGSLHVNIIKADNNILYAGTNNGLYTLPYNGNSWVADTIGLSGKVIKAITVKDTFRFAGTDEGIFIATKSNNHWNKLNNFTGSSTSLVTVGKNIFSGSNSGLLKSSDNGNQWIKCPSYDPYLFNSVFAPIINDNEKLFAASFLSGGGSVYRSDNAGDSWLKLSSDGLGSINLEALLVNKSTILAGGRGGLFRSSDYGLSWTYVEKGLPFANISSVVADGYNIFAGVKSDDANWYSGGGISISTDNGETWNPCNTGLIDLDIAGMSNIGAYIFAKATSESYISTNNGVSWTRIPILIGSGVAKGSNLFLVNGDILRSNNGGTEWNNLSNALPQYYDKGYYHYEISSIAATDSFLFAGTHGDGVYISYDDGDHWNKISSNTTLTDVYSLITRKSVIFAGTNDGIFRSTNNGVNWSKLGLSNKTINKIIIKNQFIIAAAADGIFVSSNDGSTWRQIDEGLTEKNINILALGKESLLTGTKGQGVWRRPLTEIMMPSFHTVSGIVNFGNIKLNEFKDTSIVISNTGYDTLKVSDFSSSNPVFFTSTEKVNIPPGNSITKTIRFTPAAEGTVSGNIIITSNAISSPDTIKISGNCIVTTGISDLSTGFPTEHSLSQNYPNPFNPITTISYTIGTGQLPDAGNLSSVPVQLRIFDILGNEIATLVNEYKKPGFYQVKFDAGNFPSGVYFYRIQAGSFCNTKKLILMK